MYEPHVKTVADLWEYLKNRKLWLCHQSIKSYVMDGEIC